MESNIAAFAAELGDAELACTFRQHAQRRLAAINALMWDEASGQWRDLVMAPEESQGPGGASAAQENYMQGNNNDDGSSSGSGSRFRQSVVVAASNWVPLYCGCVAEGSPQASAALASLRASGLLQPAGVAVSLQRTRQQWDWPNCWPPITCMLLEGCASYCGEPGKQVRWRWACLPACLLAVRPCLEGVACSSQPPATSALCVMHLPAALPPAAGYQTGAAVLADSFLGLVADWTYV